MDQFKVEDILAQTDFVRSLARSLVLDQSTSDDISQQALLAALERPPSRDGSIRAWFRGVVRNLLNFSRRGEVHRRERERIAARSVKVPATADIVERDEIRRIIVEALLDLDDHHRTAIQLRFFANLPPREIAKKLDIPSETVKTRLKRGIALLRQKLDREFGDRNSWCVALAPLAGLKLSTSAMAATATAPSAGSAVAGGVIMATKVKVGIAAAIIAIGSAALLWRYLPEMITEEQPSPRTVEVHAEHKARLSTPVADQITGESSAPDDEILTRKAVKPTEIMVSGRVTDKITGKPVKAFEFGMSQVGGGTNVRETVHDAQGRFAQAVEDPGTYLINIRSSRYREIVLRGLAVTREDGLTGLEIELDPGLSISGRVIDDETDLPVKGAVVGTAFSPATDLLDLLQGYDEACINTRTDEEGRFTLSGLHEGRKPIVAVHPEYAEGVVKATVGSENDIEIRLERGFRIHGTVYSDHGEPLQDILVYLEGDANPLRRPVESGPDGAFRTPPTLPGSILVRAAPPRGRLGFGMPFTHETKSVEIIDADVEVDFGPAADDITWRGTLYDYDGSPVTKGQILILPNRYGSSEKPNSEPLRYEYCDAQGRFEMRKLRNRAYGVIISLHGDEYRIEMEPVRFDEPGVVERDIRISGGVISGMVVAGSTENPWTGGERCTVCAIDGSLPSNFHFWRNSKYSARIDTDGSFCLRGIPRGSYRLVLKENDELYTPLSKVEIHDGEIIDDMLLKLPPRGRLELAVSGFTEQSSRELKLKLTREMDGEVLDLCEPSLRVGSRMGGMTRRSWSLVEGRWNLVCTADNLGFIERDFEIVRSEPTELEITKSDFESEFTTIAGRFTWQDGKPLIDARLRFRLLERMGEKYDRYYQYGTTDLQGRVSIHGFKPGRWRVRANFGPDDNMVIGEFVIPDGADDPFSLQMEVTTGEVRGSVCSKAGRLRIEDGGSGTEIELVDATTWDWVATQKRELVDGEVRINCYPGGPYFLRIENDWYEDYKSEPFNLAEGQVLDLGEIHLTPCGVIDFKIVDTEGQRINRFGVKCPQKKYNIPPHTVVGERLLRFKSLPLGHVTITISARGYRDREEEVYLEHMKPLLLEVVLEPE